METFSRLFQCKSQHIFIESDLGKDFHPIFKFLAVEHYPFYTQFVVEEEKILFMCGAYANTAQNPFT